MLRLLLLDQARSFLQSRIEETEEHGTFRYQIAGAYLHR
jgi:hypothetical protein